MNNNINQQLTIDNEQKSLEERIKSGERQERQGQYMIVSKRNMLAIDTAPGCRISVSNTAELPGGKRLIHEIYVTRIKTTYPPEPLQTLAGKYIILIFDLPVLPQLDRVKNML